METHNNRKSEKRSCEKCGEEFNTIIPNKKYCKESCRLEANELKVDRKKPKRSNCGICGKAFIWKPTAPTQKYCSKECSRISKNQKSKRKKKVDPLKDVVVYKVESLFAKATLPGNELNGKTIDYRNVGKFNRVISNEIKERDNYTCQICDFNYGRVEVHHILKRASGGDNSGSNLITLCVPCHRAIETDNMKYAIQKCYKNASKIWEVNKC